MPDTVRPFALVRRRVEQPTTPQARTLQVSRIPECPRTPKRPEKCCAATRDRNPDTLARVPRIDIKGSPARTFQDQNRRAGAGSPCAANRARARIARRRAGLQPPIARVREASNRVAKSRTPDPWRTVPPPGSRADL